MYQIQFRLGLRPRPRWGAYSAPPDPLATLRTYFYGKGRRRDPTTSRPLSHISGYAPGDCKAAWTVTDCPHRVERCHHAQQIAGGDDEGYS